MLKIAEAEANEIRTTPHNLCQQPRQIAYSAIFLSDDLAFLIHLILFDYHLDIKMIRRRRLSLAWEVRMHCHFRSWSSFYSALKSNVHKMVSLISICSVSSVVTLLALIRPSNLSSASAVSAWFSERTTKHQHQLIVLRFHVNPLVVAFRQVRPNGSIPHFVPTGATMR